MYLLTCTDQGLSVCLKFYIQKNPNILVNVTFERTSDMASKDKAIVCVLL